MRPINWLRFTWDLEARPSPAPRKLPEHYEITAVGPEDLKELRRVITTSFTLDPDWNPAMQEVMKTIEASLERAAERADTVYLALRHGVRIIGTTVVSLDPAAENHLSPGPCVLMEYRNRGFGTDLLVSALRVLRETGLPHACAVAKKNSPVTKFLYRKFNGTAVPHEAAPALVPGEQSLPEGCAAR
ncbi:hypothetical protein BH20VER2_BH20VER2_12510 [soil metagenome]